jgi:hypothetical protein
MIYVRHLEAIVSSDGAVHIDVVALQFLLFALTFLLW